MKKQLNTKKTKSATLDGAAWKAVTPAGNDTIGDAAVGLDALALALREWCDARRELDRAEADVAKRGDAIAAEVKSAAVRLRGEADRRRAEADAYTEAINAKCVEVAALHPALTGHMLSLRQYATGEYPVDKPVPIYNLGGREYVPRVNDDNRAALAAFKPVRRNPPDTSALQLPPAEATLAPVRALCDARARYEAACRKLADVRCVSDDSGAALAAAIEAEAASVEKALATQAERDA